MISLTRPEQTIRRILIREASAATPGNPTTACLSYTELGVRFDPDGLHTDHHPMSIRPFRGLNEALGHVAMYEHALGRPLLTALVVTEKERRPGPGFAELARHLGFAVDDEEVLWEEQLQAAVDFWSDDDPTRVVDAALGRVLSELSAIKRLVR